MVSQIKIQKGGSLKSILSGIGNVAGAIILAIVFIVIGLIAYFIQKSLSDIEKDRISRSYGVEPRQR